MNKLNEIYINKQSGMNDQERCDSLMRNEDNKPWICQSLFG